MGLGIDGIRRKIIMNKESGAGSCGVQLTKYSAHSLWRQRNLM